MKKRISFLSVLLCLCLLFSLLVPAASKQSPSNYDQLVSDLFTQFSDRAESFTVRYEGGLLNSALASNAVKKAISRSLPTMFSLQKVSYQFAGSDLHITAAYELQNGFDYHFIPDFDEMYTVIARAVSQHKNGLNLYLEVPDYQNNVNYVRDKVSEVYNSVIQYAGDDYMTHLVARMNFSVTSTSSIAQRDGGYRIVLNFIYNETPEQTRAVDEFCRQAVESLDLAEYGTTQKALAINNYIKDYTSYKLTGADEDYTPYGLISNRTSVCQGYAMLASKMLTEAGVDNRLVTGTSTDPATGQQGAHMWNAVRVDGAWYHLDITWNDAYPVGVNPYFLLSDEEISKDHTFDESVYSETHFNEGISLQRQSAVNTIVCRLGSPVMMAGNTLLPIDPDSTKTVAQLIDGRTYLPVRGFLEALGATVSWNQADQQITVNYHDYILDMWLGDTTVLVNGLEQTLEVPPRLVGDRTIVPIRLISELLGLGVDWDNDLQQVTLVAY